MADSKYLVIFSSEQEAEDARVPESEKLMKGMKKPACGFFPEAGYFMSFYFFSSCSS